MFKWLSKRSDKKERKTKQLTEREISISPMFKWLSKRSDKKEQKTKQLTEREINIVKEGLEREQVIASVENPMDQHKASQQASAASIRLLLQKAVTNAEQMATSIKMKAQQEAEAEAERIIDQAKQEAKQIKEAEQLAAIIKMKAQQEAKAEAERIINQAKQEADDIRSIAKVAAQKQAEKEAKLAAREEALEEKIEKPVKLEEVALEEKVEEPVKLEKEATVSEPVEATTDERPEQHLPEERPGEGEPVSTQVKLDSKASYTGEVELAIAMPVELKAVSKLYNYLQTIPSIKILRTRGYRDRGTTITIVVEEPIPLISIISKIPGVKVIPELTQEDSLVKGMPSSLPRTGEKEAKRIKLTLREA